MKRGAALTLIWAMLCAFCPAGASPDVPAFSRFADACAYIGEQVRSLEDSIRFILPSEELLRPRPAPDDRGTVGEWDMEDSVWNLIYLFPDIFRLGYGWTETADGVRVTLVPEYRFSARCLDAVRRGSLAELSDAEYGALNRAMIIAGEALGEADWGKREWKAASLLCERVSFLEPDGTKHDEENDPRSGLCALVNGRANCQGYADAYCLIMNLCGMECGLVTGCTADGQNHVWNRVYTPATHDADITLLDLDPGMDPRYLPVEESILMDRRVFGPVLPATDDPAV